MIQLRDYQEDLANKIYQGWQHHRNNLAVLPTGGGKTILFSHIINNTQYPVCAVAHRQELVGQISLALAKYGINHKIIAPRDVCRKCANIHYEELNRSYYEPNAQVAVAGVDTITKRTNISSWAKSVGLWVMDECFPAGTKIDGKNIEELKIGDIVTAFNEKTQEFEKKPITRLFKNKQPEYLVSVIVNGKETKCTFGHPFYTKRGWVIAGELTNKDEVLLNETEMYNMRERRGLNRVQKEEISRNRSYILQQEMCEQIQIENILRNHIKNKQKICIKKNERKQPNEKPFIKKKDVGNFEKNKPSTKSKRWEWKRSNKSGKGIKRFIRDIRFFKSTCGINKREKAHSKLPRPLQNRLWESYVKNSNRSGRKQSFFIGKETTGQEKRNIFNWRRVESVSVQKRGNNIKSRKNIGDGYVYNIEVQDLHTYVANGIVVHNCHHVLKKNKWGKCIEMFPNAYGLGVTATPIRADGKGLGRHSDGVFDQIVEGPTMRELIDRGFLTDYRIFAPPSNIDLSSAKVGSTGDYTKPSMKSAMKDSTVMGDVVEHYLKIAGGKLGITFAVDVETAGQIAAAFRAAGVPSEVVSANTDDRARTDILRRFKRREILQLVNVDLFGEGFDLPALEVVSMARPTQSYALYAQQFGRALRTMEGKDVAIIIDHVGNCVRHGLPDASRIWSLDAREKRSTNTPNDAIPVTACPACTMVYERTKSECPYCGHKPEPISRSGPEFVDGDLCELDPDTLRKMRGEIERVDADPSFIRQKMINAGATGLVANSAAKQHRLRQEAQSPLRNVISWWAGVHRGRGKNDNEIYRLFYHRFGIDIMSAQAVGYKDAAALTEKIFYQLGRM